MRPARTLGGVLALLLTWSCSVQVDGLDAEQARADALAARYAADFAERAVPELGPDAPLSAYVAAAESRNGVLEAAWRRWLAALAEVPAAAMQDTTAMAGFEHRLGGGPALDRTGLMLMTDQMANWMLPGRLQARGKAALARAAVAAAAYESARARLQTEVGQRWLDLALRDQEIAQWRRLAAALQAGAASARGRLLAGGGSQRALLRQEAAASSAAATATQLQTERDGLVAALWAAVGGPPPEAWDPKPQLPTQSLSEAEVKALLAALGDRSPALQEALRRREQALAQAESERWAYVPQFSLRGLLMGDGGGMIQPALTLPFLRQGAIDAAVRAADLEEQATAALLRQAQADAASQGAAAAATLRAVAQLESLLRADVAPRLLQAAAMARAEWAAGQAPLGDWTEAETVHARLSLELLSLQHKAQTAQLQLAQAAGLMMADRLREAATQ